MSENREEILANFQSITAIDDVAMAIYHLEESQWDLVTAVNRVIGNQDPDVQITTPMQQDIAEAAGVDREAATADVLLTAPSSPIRSNHQNANVLTSGGGYGSAFAPFDSGPSTSRFNGRFTSSRPETINFTVNFDGTTLDIPIRNDSTVNELKLKIQDATGVRVCRQALSGWKESIQREAQNNSTVLRALKLEPHNELVLTDMTREGYIGDTTNGGVPAGLVSTATNPADPGTSANTNQTFTLTITIRPSGETKVLKFPGRHTVLGVKTDLYSVTEIPMRHQRWTGWPAHVQNTMTLAETGIALEHNFTLESAKENRNAESGSSNMNVSMIEIDSESEEFEDAEGFDEDIFQDTTAPVRNRIKHLIPDPVDDESIGCLQFIQNYEERYGLQHPVFFQGSLGDAIKEACHKNARDRKMLAVYLHHDRSVLTNVFCGQLLGHETIVNMFLENFVVYGWDLTIESNKNLFLTSISIAVGTSAAATVRSIPVEHMPTILLVARIRSQCEVFSVIHGNIGLDDLYSSLMEAREMYLESLSIEMREEDERHARERVKMEQDEAYQESLEADRAKEEAKRQKELMMATERKRLESEKAELDAKKESVRSEAERALPAEPEQIKGPEITKIRLRQPTGEFLERRFYVTDSLQTLFNFMTSKGFPLDEYKLISSFPRRDLTALNPEDNFQQLKLYPQETIILEER